MKKVRNFMRDTGGDAVVEATILFPVMIMIFAALIVLSMYLPQSANLQRAVQRAAVEAANMQSDTGYSFDVDTMQTYVDCGGLQNVYASMFKALTPDEKETAEDLVIKLTSNGFVMRNSVLTVECEMKNYIVYKEIAVTAKEVITLPFDFSFVGLGNTITLNKSARCAVQNGDEFVRSMDIAADVATFLDDRYKISDKMFESINKLLSLFR